MPDSIAIPAELAALGLAGTAGLVDDFDLTITEAAFGYDSQYNDGKTLVLKIIGDAPDLDEDQREQRILLSTGNGWEDKDGGAVAVREDTGEPNPKGFNRSTRYQKFLLAAWEVAPNVMGGRIEKAGGTWLAEIWPGLTFHMNQVEGADVGGTVRSYLLPTALVGEVSGNGAAPKKATGAKKSTTTKGKEESTEAEGGDDGDVLSSMPKPWQVKLKKIAKDADDFDTFIERAYDAHDDMPAEVQAVVDEESGYLALKG